MVTAKPAGLGSAEGRQTFTGSQIQIIQTPYSTTKQSQTVEARQYSGIDALGKIDPRVSNKLKVRLEQNGAMSGKIVPR